MKYSCYLAANHHYLSGLYFSSCQCKFSYRRWVWNLFSILMIGFISCQEQSTTNEQHKTWSVYGGKSDQSRSFVQDQITKEIDGDGLSDIVTSSKKGTYIFLTREHEATITAPRILGKEYQFTNLFQENSLEGWKAYAANKPVDISDRWTIEDGVLHAVADGDSVGHWLVSDSTYGDFILRFEFQLLSGNSGINFHSFFDDEDVQGPQMDMANKSTGQIYDLVLKNGEYAGKYLNPQTDLGRETYKQGEWNQVEIRTQGDNIKIILNETEILDYDFESGERNGFLAWQLHSRMKMDFSVRNLEISEWEAVPTSH